MVLINQQATEVTILRMNINSKLLFLVKLTNCKNCHFYKIHKYETKYAENKQGELLEIPIGTISSQASNMDEGSETISKESTLK